VSANVFAYGSNMCSARFRDYGVTPEGPGRAARLRGYRLAFNKWSKKHRSGKANVEPHPAGEVWGVVYAIPDHELQALDDGEGPGYTRTSMSVSTPDGESLEAWVYSATDDARRDDARPFTWYKDFLVIGAKEHGLPGAYIAGLEAVMADDDPDRARDAERRELM
jgi:gamma-glutamylcyclotransferase